MDKQDDAYAVTNQQIDEEYRAFQVLCGQEHAKDSLIGRLFSKLKELNDDLRQERLDHEREKRFNRSTQTDIENKDYALRVMRAEKERDSFILVLIDGDGLIFKDSLLQAGEDGGKNAAGALWAAVRDHIARFLSDIPSDYRIVVRVFAHLKGLGSACYNAGIVDNPTTIEHFARGFSGSKQLFDFVDVGYGKDRADEKITANLYLNLGNVHCRHIILGGSHDNGYARVLEEIAQHPNANNVSLLEGAPFERELQLLKARYNCLKFEDIFRNTKINVFEAHRQTPHVQHDYGMPYPTPTNQYNISNDSGILPQGQPSTPQQPQPQSQPQQQPQGPIGYQSPYANGLARTPSSSTINSPVPTPATWANKAGAAAPVQTASPPLTPQPQAATVPRNRHGQRIDPLIKVDPLDYKRVQKIKMCNVHFLRKDCPYGDNCTHDHKYKPTKGDVDILRQVARSTPCHFGTECDDAKCIYGHRCPHQIDGQKGCRYGVNCRFGEEMHGVDTKAVRVMKIS